LEDSLSLSPPNVVRLFPLTGVVLFPHGLLPLHIFEPRYRQMTQDALAGDRAIAMALPADTKTEPPALHPMVCAGRILHEQRLPDGRFKFMLRGECRMAIRTELPTDRQYRVAKVAPRPDVLKPKLATRRQLQRSHILAVLRRLAPMDNENMAQFHEFLRDRCGFGAFADVVSYAAPLPVETKQELLDTPDVDRRLEILADAIPAALDETHPAPPLTFPPLESQQ
jgi:Lon protease-like protein